MQRELLKVALIGVGSVGKKYARMITAGEVPNMKLSAVVIRRDELIEWGESLVNTDGDNARIFRSAEELFETGESCYDAVLINSRYLRTSYYHKSGSWRSSFAGEGGGALINQGQHILDMYQYLFGMPQKLFAAIPFGKYNDFIVDDEATIVMEYDNGKTGTFILSTGEACHEERLEIIGTKARILLEDDTLTITKHRDVCEYIKNEEVNSRQNMTFAEETIQFEKASEPYAQLFENFANAVLKGDESYLTVKGSEGINSLMLCASAYYSACKGIKVELPLEASAYKELMDELIRKEGENRF